VKPLGGLRVLDLTQVLAGPYCTMMLGDLGADVVKVERPGSGDGSRSWGPPFAGGESAYYLAVNRNKRSIAIDLADPRGQGVARRLAERADVVVENFLPGVPERFGLTYEALRADHPALVVCSIRGFPSDGPDAPRPGYDFAIQGIGGIMSVTGEPDGAPMKVGVAIADITAGMFACTGILAALHERAATGWGRHVEVSLVDAQAAWLANRAGEWLIGGVEPARHGNAHPSIVPYQTFAAADGWVNVAVGTDDQYVRFCRAAGRDDLAGDPRFATNAGRVEHRDALVPVLAATLVARPVGHWVELMERERVPGGPVLTIPAALAGPAAHMVERSAHPTAGGIGLVRSPIRIDGERGGARRPPPRLGADGAAILAEAGYTDAEAADLLAGPCAPRANN
jgi:crotonobetainyl-CoA:carnitine CoA-transferase CaiB-like acyl-CoA transferase